jgi:hypothetical protein
MTAAGVPRRVVLVAHAMVSSRRAPPRSEHPAVRARGAAHSHHVHVTRFSCCHTSCDTSLTKSRSSCCHGFRFDFRSTFVDARWQNGTTYFRLPLAVPCIHTIQYTDPHTCTYMRPGHIRHNQAERHRPSTKHAACTAVRGPAIFDRESGLDFARRIRRANGDAWDLVMGSRTT